MHDVAYRHPWTDGVTTAKENSALSLGPNYVVLSPHLDDAVLSAWHIIESSELVRVVTVFAGVPRAGFVTPLDRDHGATNSANWVRRRRDEDRTVLAAARREPIHLDLLDCQYRAYDVPRGRRLMEQNPGRFVSLLTEDLRGDLEVPGLAGILGSMLGANEVVYAPAGIGRHPDHFVIACFAFLLADNGQSVRLYADTPYYFRKYGLPSWAGGVPNDEADREVRRDMARLPDLTRVRPTVVILPKDAVARKVAALRKYTTEFDHLTGGLPPGALDTMLSREAYWAL